MGRNGILSLGRCRCWERWREEKRECGRSPRRGLSPFDLSLDRSPAAYTRAAQRPPRTRRPARVSRPRCGSLLPLARHNDLTRASRVCKEFYQVLQVRSSSPLLHRTCPLVTSFDSTSFAPLPQQRLTPPSTLGLHPFLKATQSYGTAQSWGTSCFKTVDGSYAAKVFGDTARERERLLERLYSFLNSRWLDSCLLLRGNLRSSRTESAPHDSGVVVRSFRITLWAV